MKEPREGGTFRPSVLFVRISREPRRGGGGELQVSINQRESVRKDLLVVEEEEGDRSMKRLFGSAQQLPQGEKKRGRGEVRSKALCSRRRRRRYSEKEQLQTEERGKGKGGGAANAI